MLYLNLIWWLSSEESTCSAADIGDRVQTLGWEDPLEEEMATHSSILAWRIPWTEGPVFRRGVAESDTTERMSMTLRTTHLSKTVTTPIFPGGTERFSKSARQASGLSLRPRKQVCPYNHLTGLHQERVGSCMKNPTQATAWSVVSARHTAVLAHI